MKKSIKILRWFGWSLLILGGAGWFGGCASDMITLDTEFPLSELEGIGVDSYGRIYCGLQFYGMVQAYDRNGQFISRWNVPTSGAFRIKIDEYDRIHIATARGNKHHVFDSAGKRLSETVEEDIYSKFGNVNEYGYLDKSGNFYKIQRNALSPQIVKTDSFGDKTVIITSSFYLWLLMGPFPAFLFWVSGGIVLGLTTKYVSREKTEAAGGKSGNKDSIKPN